MLHRIIQCRVIGNCAQERNLRQIKIIYILIKIPPARRLYAVIAIAKVNIIKIKLHNLILTVNLL